MSIQLAAKFFIPSGETKKSSADCKSLFQSSNSNMDCSTCCKVLKIREAFSKDIYSVLLYFLFQKRIHIPMHTHDIYPTA